MVTASRRHPADKEKTAPKGGFDFIVNKRKLQAYTGWHGTAVAVPAPISSVYSRTTFPSGSPPVI